jgi:hypothetical protein
MIISGICNSFKAEILRGTHVLQSDVVKIALYTSAASIGPDTTEYTATGEAYDDVWTAGGQTLNMASGWPQLDSQGRGTLRFEELTVSGVTLTFRGMLLYNSSKANRAIAVLDKGIDIVLTAGVLRIGTNTVQPDLVFIV